MMMMIEPIQGNAGAHTELGRPDRYGEGAVRS